MNLKPILQSNRWRLSLIIVVVVVALLIVNIPSREVYLDVSCDDFMEQGGAISEEVEVSAWVDYLIVTLCSNPTTGFEWKLIEVTDQIVVEHADNEYISTEATGVVGAAGKEVWTFNLYRRGSSNITMEYSRPWEGGEQAEWTFNLAIVVR